MPPTGPVRTQAKPERSLVRLLGPAFVAAVAYVDPGNVAANLSAGAKYGYLLVWVLVIANAMAVAMSVRLMFMAASGSCGCRKRVASG